MADKPDDKKPKGLNDEQKIQLWELLQSDDYVKFLARRVVDDAGEQILKKYEEVVRLQRGVIAAVLLIVGFLGWNTMNGLRDTINYKVNHELSDVLRESRMDIVATRIDMAERTSESRGLIQTVADQNQRLKTIVPELRNQAKDASAISEQIKKTVGSEEFKSADLLAFIEKMRLRAKTNPQGPDEAILALKALADRVAALENPEVVRESITAKSLRIVDGGDVTIEGDLTAKRASFDGMHARYVRIENPNFAGTKESPVHLIELYIDQNGGQMQVANTQNKIVARVKTQTNGAGEFQVWNKNGEGYRGVNATRLTYEGLDVP